MTFGEALELVKDGGQIRRPDWRDKQFAYLNPGSVSVEDLKGRDRIANALKNKLFEAAGVDTVTRLPNLNMKAADGSTLTGWVPSQIDMLAEDWETV